MRGAKLAGIIKESFSDLYSVQDHDIGCGSFVSKNNAIIGNGEIKGYCIYDETNGSLRLTQRLYENYTTVLEHALEVASTIDDEERSSLIYDIERYIESAKEMKSTKLSGVNYFNGGYGRGAVMHAVEKNVVEVIAIGSRGIYRSEVGPKEVIIKDYRYTPNGMLYILEPEFDKVKWEVACAAVEPVNGQSVVVKYDLLTGEVVDK